MHDERQGLPWLAMLEATVLVAWIAGFGWLARGSKEAPPLLGLFIRSDYWWLVYAAIGILIALGASLAVSQPHQHGLGRLKSLIQIIVLCFPLLCLHLATTSDLSIGAAERRSLYTPRVVTSRTQAPKLIKVRPKSKSPTGNVKAVKAVKTPIKVQQPTLLDLVSDPDRFQGSHTALVGIVHRDKRLPGASFFCYRLVMVCCAADATPAGVIVEWPESRKLKTGTWVKVGGRVTMTQFEAGDYPAIMADKVEKTKPPRNRFIIPK
ncbi:MAG: TIGR03943 family protein [Desulfomonilaceae bacterium]